MTLVNLTPHPVNLYGNRPVEEGPSEVIPPSGTVARIATIDLGTAASKTAVYELVEYGHAHDLPQPQPQPGIDYIVSLVVALACHRDDLLAPYVEVRNEQGIMIGCRYLQKVC